MTDYQGMRWLKCDLQIQTPEDSRHWNDEELCLGSPRRSLVNGAHDESAIQEKARIFLRRCHDLNLEIIGITDHNFSGKTDPRDWFITHLVEQNRAVAQELNRLPLYILPGFEVDIGFHVLCLFGPAKKQNHLWRISQILTKLGLPENQRFKKNACPEPLRYNGEMVSLKRLLEIVQKEHEGIVIAAHADQNKGILSDPQYIGDYQLPDLLAVELTSNPPQANHAEILNGKNSQWSRRERQPAWIMSSDAKSLRRDKDGNPTANAIGYRYTWIKMSEPSITALRQAFLDSESRIWRSESGCSPIRPSDRQTHPRIRRLRISGLGFLTDQDIVWSPNLNCVIGGRGSGKSTLLECLRLALGKEGSTSEIVAKKLKRLRGVFKPDTKIWVEWEGVPGQIDTLLLHPQSGEHSLVDGEAPDFPTYLRQLPVQFFSQQQLSELTGAEIGGNRLLPLIDAACGAALQALESEERTLRTEIQQLFAAQDQQEAVRENIRRLRQEIAEFDRQWQARQDVQQEASAHQYAQQASRFLETSRARVREESDRIRSLAEDLGEALAPLGSESAHWPRAEWFQALDRNLEVLTRDVQQQLEQAASFYEDSFLAYTERNSGWPALVQELASAESRFLEACRERGLQPSDVSRLQEIDRQRQAKRQELAAQEKQETQLSTRVKTLPERFAALHGAWQRQFELRQKAVEDINSKAGGTIRASVRYAADQSTFDAVWRNRLSPDRRSRLGKNWEELGNQIFQAFVQEQENDADSNGCGRENDADSNGCASPWELIVDVIRGETELHVECQDLLPDLNQHLNSKLTDWRQARLTRVADFADIELLDAEDGRLLGKVSDPQLSEGQRNTAVLNLLLAQGNGPIVIDQPEDELDSNFIYRDLVPLLRRVKEHRQIIVATHNANLPVNGDAELIYALEARGDHGYLRAAGGLDRPAVTQAVLDIMEGSREAFRRRREKYHF